MKNFQEGSTVEWNWSNGTAKGKVKEVYKEEVEKEISGSKVKRKASPSEPAYLVEQDDGSQALKSHSELESVS
jgi:hypothetical protein